MPNTMQVFNKSQLTKHAKHIISQKQDFPKIDQFQKQEFLNFSTSKSGFRESACIYGFSKISFNTKRIPPQS